MYFGAIAGFISLSSRAHPCGKTHIRDEGRLVAHATENRFPKKRRAVDALSTFKNAILDSDFAKTIISALPCAQTIQRF